MKTIIRVVVVMALMAHLAACGGMKEAKARAEQNREMQGLIGVAKSLRIYASNHDGAYPASLDDPSFLKGLGSSVRERLEVKNWQTGEIARAWYVRSHAADSSAKAILLASPWVYDDRRVVVFFDGGGKVAKENGTRSFQEALTETLKMGGRELLK